jgi:hypothetical protein
LCSESDFQNSAIHTHASEVLTSKHGVEISAQYLRLANAQA